jgi:hypothetical protein
MLLRHGNEALLPLRGRSLAERLRGVVLFEKGLRVAGETLFEGKLRSLDILLGRLPNRLNDKRIAAEPALPTRRKKRGNYVPDRGASFVQPVVTTRDQSIERWHQEDAD